jgi:hypothetical protein
MGALKNKIMGPGIDKVWRNRRIFTGPVPSILSDISEVLVQALISPRQDPLKFFKTWICNM